MSRITWQQDHVAGVPLKRFIGVVGSIEAGSVSYDGSNRLWVWASPLQDEAWGYGPTEHAAKAAFEIWLSSWLQNFKAFFETPTERCSHESQEKSG